MNNSYLLDTNIIIRFLTEDDSYLSNKAVKLFKRAAKGQIKLIINAVTMAEVFYVLTSSIYNIPKNRAAELLIMLVSLKGVYIKPKDILTKVLNLLTTKNLAFVDAYNLFFAINNDLKLKTFDHKLARYYKKIREGIN